MPNLPQQLETISNFQTLDEAYTCAVLESLKEFEEELSSNSDFLTLQMVLEDNLLTELTDPLVMNGITLDIKKGDEDEDIITKVNAFLKELSAKRIDEMREDTKEEIIEIQEENNEEEQNIYIPENITPEEFLDRKPSHLNADVIEEFIRKLEPNKLQSTDLEKKVFDKLARIIRSKSIKHFKARKHISRTDVINVINHIKRGHSFIDSCKWCLEVKNERNELKDDLCSNLYFGQKANENARELDNMIKNSLNIDPSNTNKIALEDIPLKKFNNKINIMYNNIMFNNTNHDFSIMNILTIVTKGLEHYFLDKTGVKLKVSPVKAKNYLVLLIKGENYQRAID